MKTKIYRIGLLSMVLMTMVGCQDYLTAPEPGKTQLDDYFTSAEAATANVTACYAPLMWEYDGTYYSEWFIGDIVSDDALKGGQNTNDMGAAYDMENWKTISTNGLLLDFYRGNYIGVARCNLSLQYIPEMATDTVFTPELKNRLLGEAHYLRGYYYFRLVRVFGGVPLTTKVIDSADEWEQPRASVESIFNQIIADFTAADSLLCKRSELTDDQVGRATQGAAQAMLMKTNLYLASPYWNEQVSGDAATYYAEAVKWGKALIESEEYELCPVYADNFTLAGENGVESVFEVQYMEVPWGDYGEGNGFTAGSFTPILIRSRSSQIGGGWGFNHPTWNLYNEFEATDGRRDVAILNPDPALMENKNEETYLGSPLLNNKYALYGEYPGSYSLHASRGPLNNKHIRYADVLLMYAEACLGAGDEGMATTYLNKVRERAGLATYPGYGFAVNGQTIASPTLEQALRHERRMELAMEGHRWFDLVRWSDTKAHMEAYQATESDEAKAQMAVFQAGKHEIFPIPAEERQLNPALTQNPGY